MTQVMLDGAAVDLEAAPGDSYLRSLATGGGDTRFLAAAFRELQPPGAVALDVGANIGLTSLLMSRLRPDGSVLALEPSTSTFGFLQRNLARNDARNAQALRLALGREPGRLGWSQDPRDGSSAHLAALEGEGVVEVEVSTLDALVEARGVAPSFVKIDVEGFEMEVLAGAERTLREMNPVLFVELNSFTLVAYGDCSPKALLDHLLARFAHVYWAHGDVLKELRGAPSVLELLHLQFTTGACVHDLLCIPHGRSFEPARLAAALGPTPPPPATTDAPPAYGADLRLQFEALQAQHAAMTGSRTWRLALRLRAALARLGV